MIVEFSELTDERVLMLVRTDPAAIAELYRRHHSSVRRALSARIRDASVVEDLAAETWAQALLSHRRYRDQGPGSARAWLLGIAINLFRRYCEHRSVERRAMGRLGLQTTTYVEDSSEQIDDRLMATALVERLDNVISCLPASQRAALKLRITDDLTFDDVAAAQGCLPATSRQHVSRALRTLRAHLLGGQQ